MRRRAATLFAALGTVLCFTTPAQAWIRGRATCEHKQLAEQSSQRGSWHSAQASTSQMPPGPCPSLTPSACMCQTMVVPTPLQRRLTLQEARAALASWRMARAATPTATAALFLHL